MAEARSLVRCRVSRGFFKSEVLVLVAESSAYVNRESVEIQDDPQEGEVDGWVWARVIEDAEDRALIELPGQPVVGGVRTWVPRTALERAAV